MNPCSHCLRRMMAWPRKSCVCSKVCWKAQWYFAITQFSVVGMWEEGRRN